MLRSTVYEFESDTVALQFMRRALFVNGVRRVDREKLFSWRCRVVWAPEKGTLSGLLALLNEYGGECLGTREAIQVKRLCAA